MPFSKILVGAFCVLLCFFLHLANSVFVDKKAPPDAALLFSIIGDITIAVLWIWIFQKLTGEQRVNVLFNVGLNICAPVLAGCVWRGWIKSK